MRRHPFLTTLWDRNEYKTKPTLASRVCLIGYARQLVCTIREGWQRLFGKPVVVVFLNSGNLAAYAP